jgi:hypothetical protein
MPTQSDNPNPEFFFHGFGRPTYTQVPDEVFDELLSKLSGAELKVLLYIIRRTFGFKKESDSISLSQLVNGIRTRDGERLDSGTGLSKGAVAMAVKSLEAKGVLLAERDRTKEKGDVPTTYALRFNGDPVSNNRTGGSLKNEQARVRKTDTQQTVEQQTVRQHTVDSKEFEGQTIDIKSDNSRFSKKSHLENKISGSVSRNQLGQIGPHRGSDFTAVGDVITTAAKRPAQSRPGRAESAATPNPGSITTPLQKQAPERPTGRRGRRGLADQAPPAIAALIEQFSGEFHDEDHVPSNISQAVRLWHASGQAETSFTTAMYEARARTKKAPGIEKRAGGEAGEWGMRNKMPYYFACLRDVLGMKPPPGSS